MPKTPPNILWNLSSDRFFDPDSSQRRVARQLYETIANLPIISPHGHVDPALFADEHASFGTPTDLLIIPDHYVYRMLYSQGYPLAALGVPYDAAGSLGPDDIPVETDHRKIWQIFAENFHLFRGTPTGIWLAQELSEVFGVPYRLNGANAQQAYDIISERLASADFRPRRLFERFNIQVLCTTDPAWDSLHQHQAIHNSGWKVRILPTFRPDAVINLDAPGWRRNIEKLSEVSGISVTSYVSFIQALERQRAFFKSMGATATDHAVLVPNTCELSATEAETIFLRALRSTLEPGDVERFSSHMLMEMARMSVEDGLVMQLHPGSLRNHNAHIFERFGGDKGADIPIAVEFARALRPLLAKYGAVYGSQERINVRLRLILFTLDETTYARELAPLAGHYPSVVLGPPWWFHDSLNGMRRYFDQVMETAGLYNTAGFNDDTRAFPSIPARHDVWRRASANWLAGLLVRNIIAEDEALEMVQELAVGLACRAYHC